MNISKRHYHPLLIYAFYKNKLSDQQLKLIPKTTLAYWRKHSLENFYGFDWIISYEKEFIYPSNERFKIVRFIGYLCSFFQKTIPSKSLKKQIKKNISTFIFTFERIYQFTSNIKTTSRILGISYNYYYRLKNKLHCTASVLNLCLKNHPAQLTTIEATTIERALNNPSYQNLPLLSIYYNLLNSSLLYCCISTFYKYSSLLRNYVPKRKKLPTPSGFRANDIFEYLHIDTTFVDSENEGKLRVVFVKDNFSKAILAATSPFNGSSAFIKSALEMAFDYHNLPQDILTSIVSDDGSENKGEVNTWIASFDPSRVIKLTAKLDFPFSNSMVESTNHIFKNVFLKNISIIDRAHLLSLLKEFVHYNNSLRYPGNLYGYTPLEVLNGALPDKNKFKDNIKKAMKARVESNRKWECKTDCRE